MLPGMGGLEFIVIALLALVVVGPKDLPILLRRLGKMTAKVRNMADEFRASFDELARQSELDELRQQVEALRAERFTDPIRSEIETSLHEVNEAVQPTAYRYDPNVGGEYTPPSDNGPAIEPPAKPKRTRAAASKAMAPKAKAPKTPPKPAAKRAPAPRKRKTPA